MDPYYTRIALLKYSSRAWARIVFNFQDSLDADAVNVPFPPCHSKELLNWWPMQRVISTTDYTGGTTDTNFALEMGAKAFDPTKGARPGLAE